MSVERGSLVGSEHKSMLANAAEDRDRLALTGSFWSTLMRDAR